MTQPEKPCASVAEQTEPPSPPCAHALRMPRRKPVAMKVNVPRLVAEDELAHVGERFIAHISANDAVVSCAHDLDNEQHQHFKLNAKRPTACVEQSESQRVGDEFGSDSFYRACQQA